METTQSILYSYILLTVIKTLPLEGNSFISIPRWMNDQEKVSPPKTQVYCSLFLRLILLWYKYDHLIWDVFIPMWQSLNEPSFMYSFKDGVGSSFFLCLWRKEFPLSLCLNDILFSNEPLNYTVFFIVCFMTFFLFSSTRMVWWIWFWSFLNHQNQRSEWLFKNSFS